MTPQLIPAWRDGRLQQVEKLEVHQKGLRHKAVSVFVLHGGDVLLQRRALGKYHSPGLWANTCCTHPFWDEPASDCAHRRLAEELGLSGLTLLPAGQVEYRADVGQGLTEHELVDVFLAHTAQRPPLTPDRSEVAETQWRALADLQADLARNPAAYTAWLHLYMTRHFSDIFGSLLKSG
jgi:isopentenyl-diphosphate Delta-isomerase